ncbi:MAG TPA: hypothetical protein VGB55_08895, partial [Tepidisphaeraceae bacterium]
GVVQPHVKHRTVAAVHGDIGSTLGDRFAHFERTKARPIDRHSNVGQIEEAGFLRVNNAALGFFGMAKGAMFLVSMLAKLRGVGNGIQFEESREWQAPHAVARQSHRIGIAASRRAAAAQGHHEQKREQKPWRQHLAPMVGLYHR